MIELKQTRADDRHAAFDLIADGERVGFCQIRRRTSHSPEVPAEAASHFYFEVTPEHRARGYGRRMLALAMNEARRMGLNEMIITADEENTASRRAIEANGGQLTGIFPCADGGSICRYEIALAGNR